MKMKTKFLLLILLCIAMIFALASCESEFGKAFMREYRIIVKIIMVNISWKLLLHVVVRKWVIMSVNGAVGDTIGGEIVITITTLIYHGMMRFLRPVHRQDEKHMEIAEVVGIDSMKIMNTHMNTV